MTSINLNVTNQVTAKGKMELTPNGNVFTVKVSSGSDVTLKPAMAVEIDSSGTGVALNVKPLTSSGKIFGFIILNHKNNANALTSTTSEYVEIASDNCIMVMEASGTINQGAYVKYAYNTYKIATASTSGDVPCGIALEKAGADGDLIKVLIKAPNVPASIA